MNYWHALYDVHIEEISTFGLLLFHDTHLLFASYIKQHAMFSQASSFNQNLSNWNTSSVTDFVS
jgi:surface protein